LYRNLGLFAFPFAMIDGSFSILRMPDLLTGPKSPPSLRVFNRHLRDRKLFSAGGKEFGDVVDRVVFGSLGLAAGLRFFVPRSRLIFVFVGVVGLGSMWLGDSYPGVLFV